MNKEEFGTELLGGIMMPICDKTVNHETASELTIPEYLPELRKLLSVSEKVFPPAKYVSPSEVECNGNIDYKILYIGTDGGLYSASSTAEYELSVPIENTMESELTEGMTATVYTACDGTTARAVSPRKLNLKSRLRTHACAYARLNTNEGLYGEDGHNTLQRLYKQAENCIISTASSDVIEINEEISGMGDDVRVISADATVFVGELSYSSGGLLANGDVNLKLLTCKESGSAQTTDRKLRFSGELDMGNIPEGCQLRAAGNVTDITVNVEEGKILCAISLTVDALAVKNRMWQYTADIYSTERECECRQKNISLPVAAACACGNFSQSERISLKETGFPEGASVLDAWGKVVFDGCDYSDGKYIFSGQSKYSLLCERDGEYSVTDVELPVKYELDGKECEEHSFNAIAEPISCRVRAEGDTLAIDAEIAVSADVMGKNTIKAVGEVSLGDVLPKQKCRMVVYYPAEGETPWEVAKKYHVPADTLSSEKSYYMF